MRRIAIACGVAVIVATCILLLNIAWHSTDPIKIMPGDSSQRTEMVSATIVSGELTKSDTTYGFVRATVDGKPRGFLTTTLTLYGMLVVGQTHKVRVFHGSTGEDWINQVDGMGSY